MNINYSNYLKYKKNISIRVIENGGDGYYPTGGIKFNISDFLE